MTVIWCQHSLLEIHKNNFKWIWAHYHCLDPYETFGISVENSTFLGLIWYRLYPILFMHSHLLDNTTLVKFSARSEVFNTYKMTKNFHFIRTRRHMTLHNFFMGWSEGVSSYVTIDRIGFSLKHLKTYFWAFCDNQSEAMLKIFTKIWI